MTVLMLGQQLELGHYRAEFLRFHGFRVIFPESKNEAISAIRAGDFDAAIISYTLSRNTARQLAKLIKQVSPDCPMVAISRQGDRDTDFERDETVLYTDPPQSLIDALVRIGKRQLQREEKRS
ncbi:MAG TPA: hypothetical protein VF133_18085 [Terriglobales bacterium]